MRFIRFIQIGPANNAIINNLVDSLNDIQKEFYFSFDDDTVNYPANIDLDKQVPTEPLERLAVDYTRRKSPSEYPIAICDCKLKDDVLSSSDEKAALITTKDWQVYWPNFSLQAIIAFTLVDILLSLYINIGVHYDTRGCPLDYCDKKSDMNLGLDTCEFCLECRNKILQAFSRGQISLSEYVAIQKILDFVAQRKICFVLMPFSKPYTNIYNRYIKPVITSHNWECRRADEIYEPREIIDLIQEQILRADVVVAEVTGRNPNVFYELGYAHAVAKNTILLTQSIDDVPFDLRHRQLVHYSPTSTGYKRLVNSLSQYFKPR